MILYAGKWRIRTDRMAAWKPHLAAFTRAVRSEPGVVFFDVARHVDEADTYTVIEAFADDAAEAAHAGSDHFRAWLATAPHYTAETPKVLRIPLPGTAGWDLFDAAVAGSDAP